MCGEEILAIAQKCKHCGEYLTETGEPAGVRAKSRLSFILLGLFFGWMGVHNAYIGHPLRGFIQLILWPIGLVLSNLTGLGTLSLFYFAAGIAILIANPIWIFLEICTVTKDSNGLPLR